MGNKKILKNEWKQSDLRTRGPQQFFQEGAGQPALRNILHKEPLRGQPASTVVQSCTQGIHGQPWRQRPVSPTICCVAARNCLNHFNGRDQSCSTCISFIGPPYETSPVLGGRKSKTAQIINTKKKKQDMQGGHSTPSSV